MLDEMLPALRADEFRKIARQSGDPQEAMVNAILAVEARLEQINDTLGAVVNVIEET